MSKICEYCNLNFLPENLIHKRRYCSKACALEAAALRDKNRVETKESPFPYYTCEFCGHRWMLDFDPRDRGGLEKWQNVTCPECGQRRIPHFDI